jgi:hypothetical protein
LSIFLFWIGLSIAVGMFAEIRRNRSGVGWFLLALLTSPLLAFAFCAILEPIKLTAPASTVNKDDPATIQWVVCGIIALLPIAALQ